MTTVTPARNRGRIASLWLIFLGLLYLVMAITIVIIAADPSVDNTQQTRLPFLIVLLVISVGAVLALWFWRKAGLYVLALTSIGLTIIITSLGVEILMAIFPLTGVALLWSLLQPHWADYH